MTHYCDQRTPIERNDPQWMQYEAAMRDKLCLKELQRIDNRFFCPKHGFCWTPSP